MEVSSPESVNNTEENMCDNEDKQLTGNKMHAHSTVMNKSNFKPFVASFMTEVNVVNIKVYINPELCGVKIIIVHGGCQYWQELFLT